MKRDLHHILQDDSGGTSTGAVASIAPAAYATATTNGSEADLKGFRSAEIVLDIGADTDGTHTFTIQESNTSGSGFSAVADADLRGGANAIVDPAAGVVLRGYVGNKRYLRVVLTQTSTTTGLVCGAVILRGHKANKGQVNAS